MLDFKIDSDKKLSKQMIIDLCNSTEFAEFKDSLMQLNIGIDTYELDTIISSILNIGRTSEVILSKLNSSLKYRIERYLTTEQIDKINMESDGDRISLVYKEYVPSYIKDGVYTSVETELVTVNFAERKVLMKDIVKSYEEANKLSLKERRKVKNRLDELKKEILEMERNQDSKSYVIEKVKSVNSTKDDGKIIDRIKVMFDKDILFKYQVEYDEMLVEMKEEYSARAEDFAKMKPFDYEIKLLEVRELQKGLMRRLIGMNFSMDFESKDQIMDLKRSTVDIFKMYGK